MSNPFKPHALNLFSQRDTIDEALAYANQLINALDAGDRVAALTALMVVVNTAAKVWPEADTQSDLDGRIEALASRVVDLEQSLNSTARVGWTRDELVALTRDEVSDWADQHFNDRADGWLNDHADLDHEIERWMENNFDLENDVREVLNSANLSITF